MGYNPVLTHTDRQTRRHVLSAEERNRKSGQWGEWETLAGSFPGHGWLREVKQAHRNRVFAVLERLMPDGTRHLAVSSLSGVRPTWPEMQRIKDEIAGPNATAVEVYPPHSEIVDGADMFHIWVLPSPLPFSLCADRAGPSPVAREG